MDDFTDLQLPLDGEYSSDDGPIPIDFFLSVLPYSREVYLKLGYFSSSAIQVLAYGFAQFVANGGSMSIATNHFLYERDLGLLQDRSNDTSELPSGKQLHDPEWIYEQLTDPGRHFLDCLKSLAKAGRLTIVPVMLKPARMVHYKEGVFIDKFENTITFTGSCNFTGNGLTENGESLSIARSWLSQSDEDRCNKRLKNIASITNKENDAYTYLSPEQVLDAALSLGKERTVEELLEQERSLIQSDHLLLNPILRKHEKRLEEAITVYRTSPRFPYTQGPRGYQSEAYQAWLKNGSCGIFAMATGTGKTITSLNCLLRNYQEYGFYQAVILVPTKALIVQWQSEVAAFNFTNVFSAYSGNSNWPDEIGLLNTSLSFDSTTSFVLISTYDTFTSEKLLKQVAKFPNTTLLIADEAHNFGRDSIKKNLEIFPFEKRLALSATPKRRFDEEGNKLIEEYFRDSEPYVYSFSMERAIDEGVLCRYSYFPHIVELTPEEMALYAEISAKLSRLFNHNEGTFFNPEFAKILLLERRRVIHKAVNKLNAFSEIIENLEKKNKLSYCFVYAPEGENADGVNLLMLYMKAFKEKAPNRKAHHYTSETENRDEVMSQFENENIDTLFSMKCLDEGVDIPRAETAVFCSSTGNPRQFIQRRGRVLRQHPDKVHAVIHDLIVTPDTNGMSNIDQALENKLISDELLRVVYFASLSKNYYDVMNSLTQVAERYNLNIYALQKELAEQ
ncbi:DEAD/DEAH box helicase family protein [Nitrincola alkalilacustris]|uniref:DEAD/DEAH box helicase family protein n=1 Tax=Nitrincola alkalilacustris TaxID=1571224 RepID=UPI00124CFE6C|nr:DEAD/DEAH box helicase family protein [Nitrincola alkalilacustris]